MPRSERGMALVGVQFSRGSSARGGQAPALRLWRPPSSIVGRGPVPRRAPGYPTIAGETLGCACGIRGPPRYGCQGRLPFIVGRGPVPRRASIGTGNGLGLRAVFARVERSRGTGPRATVVEAASLHHRAPRYGKNRDQRSLLLGIPRFST